MNRQKIEQQTRDGVIVMGWSIEPIEQLTCILPAKLTLQRVDDVRPQLRAMPYSSLLAAVRGEFAAANQMQEDRTIINTANIFAVYAVLHNPAFGAEVRALLAEVRRNRRNLGLSMICKQGRFAFGVSTGLANMAMAMIGKPQAQETFATPEAAASANWRTPASST